MSTGVAASRWLPWPAAHVRAALRGAAPALGAYAGIRACGVVVLWLVANASGRSLHHILVSWDSQWYAHIAAHGYGFVRIHPDGRHLSDYAFFPLYPMCERALGTVTGLPYVDAGLCISAVGSLLSAAGIFVVTRRLYGERVGMLTTVLWAAFPVAIVESMAYSESLFTALAVWSLYGVLDRRWLLAGLLACLAGMTRPVGAAVVLAVMVAAVASLLANRRTEGPARQGSPVAAVVLAPLGLLAYLAFVGVREGTAFGYFHVTAQWGNAFDGGLAFARWIWGFLSGDIASFGAGVGLCTAVGVLVWLTGLVVGQRQPLALAVFTVVMVALALTTSGYFGSKPRYVLPAFPLLIPLARWLCRQPRIVGGGVVVAFAAVSICYGATWWMGAGPL